MSVSFTVGGVGLTTRPFEQTAICKDGQPHLFSLSRLDFEAAIGRSAIERSFDKSLAPRALAGAREGGKVRAHIVEAGCVRIDAAFIAPSSKTAICGDGTVG
jgi:hypothetical protein